MTASFTVLPYKMIPHPSTSIPFHTQAFPIQDPLQVHTQVPQRNVVNSSYSNSNTLPFGRFLGTDMNQIHQPHFLGGNERIVFESSW